MPQARDHRRGIVTQRDPQANEWDGGTMEKLTCSVKEAMEATSIGKTKLYELIGDGALDTIKIGTRRLIVIESLKRLTNGELNAEFR